MFAAIFTLEAVLKIIAYGRRYFLDGWNVFDFTIVVGTIAGIVMTLTSKVGLGASTSVIRSFRIGRVFKLVKRFKSLKIIFNTFIMTLPALANVGSLLLLFLYIYAILGMNLFATIKINGPMHELLNFKNVFVAFLTLFRVATGENWQDLMEALRKEDQVLFQCVEEPSYSEYAAAGYETLGCGAAFATVSIYFFTYVLLVSLIFLNLYIAIIL